MRTRTLGIIMTLVGLALIALAVYQAYSQPQVFIASYDMNGDGVINLKDFDLNHDGLVSWVDVKLVQDTVNTAYVARYDFNRDGKVDQTDVAIVTAWIGEERMALYDMNGDGVVDWHDLDVNNDGRVNIYDVATVAAAYNSTIGEPNYNPRVDFNQDGVIDDADVNLLKPYYGYYGYSLTIYDLFKISTPLSQLFIGGVIVTVLGLITTIKKGGR